MTAIKEAGDGTVWSNPMEIDEPDQTMTINDLPDELRAIILSNLNERDMMSTVCVSRNWRDVTILAAKSEWPLIVKLIRDVITTLPSYDNEKKELEKIIQEGKIADSINIKRLKDNFCETIQKILNIFNQLTYSDLCELETKLTSPEEPQWPSSLISLARINRDISSIKSNPSIDKNKKDKQLLEICRKLIFIDIDIALNLYDELQLPYGRNHKTIKNVVLSLFSVDRNKAISFVEKISEVNVKKMALYYITKALIPVDLNKAIEFADKHACAINLIIGALITINVYKAIELAEKYSCYHYTEEIVSALIPIDIDKAIQIAQSESDEDNRYSMFLNIAKALISTDIEKAASVADYVASQLKDQFFGRLATAALHVDIEKALFFIEKIEDSYSKEYWIITYLLNELEVDFISTSQEIDCKIKVAEKISDENLRSSTLLRISRAIKYRDPVKAAAVAEKAPNKNAPDVLQLMKGGNSAGEYNEYYTG